MKPNLRLSSKPNSLRGFTLVELLIVILIIALLAALLFPLARRMRDKADQAKCVGQFRNWATAISGYAADNSGKYEVANVAPVSYTIEDCTPYIEYWVPGIDRLDDKNYEKTPTFDEAVNVHRTMRCCPNLNKGGQTPVTITMVTPASGTVSSVNRPKRGKDMPLSIIKNPTRFMIMIETVAGTTPTGYNAVPSEFQTKVKPLTVKGKDYRHSGNVNVLMADMGVKNMTWKEIDKGTAYWNVP